MSDVDDEPLGCPGCGEEPPASNVAAEIMAPCRNDDCRVNTFRWREQ